MLTRILTVLAISALAFSRCSRPETAGDAAGASEERLESTRLTPKQGAASSLTSTGDATGEDATQLRGESENYSVSVQLTKADPTELAPGEQAFLDITIINKVSGDTVSRRSVTSTTKLTKLQILDAEQGGIIHGLNLGRGTIPTVVSLTDATPVDIICDRNASFSPNKVTREAVRVLKIHAAFERADLETVRLLPAHFVGAPEPVKTTLSRLGCRIPQPWGESKPHNLIRGEFMEAGRTLWAALCSRNRSAAIIVIEEDGRVRAKLASRPDWRELQSMGDELGYSRGLSPVGRDFILDMYQAYGGPKPPPIDHQGIDDAFVGKYSSVHYFHEGKWLLLNGAD